MEPHGGKDLCGTFDKPDVIILSASGLRQGTSMMDNGGHHNLVKYVVSRESRTSLAGVPEHVVCFLLDRWDSQNKFHPANGGGMKCATNPVECHILSFIKQLDMCLASFPIQSVP